MPKYGHVFKLMVEEGNLMPKYGHVFELMVKEGNLMPKYGIVFGLMVEGEEFDVQIWLCLCFEG